MSNRHWKLIEYRGSKIGWVVSYEPMTLLERVACRLGLRRLARWLWSLR